MPPNLKGAKDIEIREWARAQLNGQEPDLKKSEVRAIKNGQLEEVVLRPRKKGFFAPDGTFIEAFEFTPDFGGDLEAAEKEWEEEEEDRAWADKENELFNKAVVGEHPRVGLLLWEHGKRIVEHADQRDMSVSYHLHVLDRRKTSEEGYSRHTHQTSVDFYRWLPELSLEESILDWRWERIDAVLRFSNSNATRNHVRQVIENTALGEVRDDTLVKLLGTKMRGTDLLLQSEELGRLEELRRELQNSDVPGDELISGCVGIIERTKGARRSEQGRP